MLLLASGCQTKQSKAIEWQPTGSPLWGRSNQWQTNDIVVGFRRDGVMVWKEVHRNE